MKIYAMLLLSALVVHTAFAEDQYTEVSYKELKVSPETYKNKRVVYSAPFLNVSATFFPYMEKSGFKPTKYLWIIAGSHALPAMAKKSETISQFIANLKRGKQITIYGKIKKFRVKPKYTIHPHYYVLVENMEMSMDEAPATDLPASRKRKPRPLRP